MKEGTGDGGDRWCLVKDNKGEMARRRGTRTRQQGAYKRRDLRVCLARIGCVMWEGEAGRVEVALRARVEGMIRGIEKEAAATEREEGSLGQVPRI